MQLAEAIKQGWEIDEEHYPVHSFSYEAWLFRDIDEDNPPKMTPAEKMEKARAARAEKIAERKAAEKENE
jgi:hypothetical protein